MLDLPLRTTGQHAEASRSPAQLFSTAYGMTIRAPDHGRSSPAAATALRKKKSYTIIKADLVIEDRMIAWVGAQAEVPEGYTSAPHSSRPWAACRSYLST